MKRYERLGWEGIGACCPPMLFVLLFDPLFEALDDCFRVVPLAVHFLTQLLILLLCEDAKEHH